MSVMTGAGRPSRPVRDDLWALVDQAQSGDSDAFGELYAATRAEIHAHLLRLVCDHHAAEDLTAETYLKAWRNIGSLQRLNESPIGWLKVIGSRLALTELRKPRARNEVLADEVRGRTREGRPEHLDGRDPTADPAHGALDLAVLWEVARDRLTDGQRDALTGRYLLDMPGWAEVGAWMGRSARRANGLGLRALQVLRDDPRVAALNPALDDTRDALCVDADPRPPAGPVEDCPLSRAASTDPLSGASRPESDSITCSDYRSGVTVSVSGLDTPTRDGGITMQVTIGKVSNRKGARDHLDIHGRAHCGAGRGIIDPATRRVPDATIDTTAVCRRCLKALRAALDARPADDIAAAGAAHYLQTPAEAATHDSRLADDVRSHLRAVHAARHQPTEATRLGLTGDDYRRRLLADLAGDPLPAGFTTADLLAA